jgi:hypothetical protein
MIKKLIKRITRIGFKARKFYLNGTCYGKKKVNNGKI